MLSPNVTPGPGVFQRMFAQNTDATGDEEAAFGFVFEEETLRRGGKTTVPARITGIGDSGVIVDAGFEDPTGRVTALSWTDGELHVRGEGRWCYSTEVDIERNACRTVRTFEGEAWLPFGDAHDGAAPYVEEDSPVQALYREAVERTLRGGGFTIPIPGTPGRGDGPPPTGPSGDGDASGGQEEGFVCECTCEVFEEIEALAEEMESGESPPDMATIQAIGTCTMQCVMEFAGCGN